MQINLANEKANAPIKYYWIRLAPIALGALCNLLLFFFVAMELWLEAKRLVPHVFAHL